MSPSFWLPVPQPRPTFRPPTGKPTSPPATIAPSGTDAAAGPPACLDAKLVWADSLDRLLLANCADQEDLASVETVWAWNGSAWELLADDGPPSNVVTGVGWDADRDVLVRYGGIPLPSQECSTETWEWDTTEWREVAAEPPAPCDHVELAWDATAGRMLLVGGGRGQELVPGTWAVGRHRVEPINRCRTTAAHTPRLRHR